jgi:hypothetical protein
MLKGVVFLLGKNPNGEAVMSYLGPPVREDDTDEGSIKYTVNLSDRTIHVPTGSLMQFDPELTWEEQLSEFAEHIKQNSEKQSSFWDTFRQLLNPDDELPASEPYDETMVPFEKLPKVALVNPLQIVNMQEPKVCKKKQKDGSEKETAKYFSTVTKDAIENRVKYLADAAAASGTQYFFGFIVHNNGTPVILKDLNGEVVYEVMRVDLKRDGIFADVALAAATISDVEKGLVKDWCTTGSNAMKNYYYRATGNLVKVKDSKLSKQRHWAFFIEPEFPAGTDRDAFEKEAVTPNLFRLGSFLPWHYCKPNAPANMKQISDSAQQQAGQHESKQPEPAPSSRIAESFDLGLGDETVSTKKASDKKRVRASRKQVVTKPDSDEDDKPEDDAQDAVSDAPVAKKARSRKGKATSKDTPKATQVKIVKSAGEKKRKGAQPKGKKLK